MNAAGIYLLYLAFSIAVQVMKHKRRRRRRSCASLRGLLFTFTCEGDGYDDETHLTILGVIHVISM
jgi:hypothetical protein